MQSNKAFGIYTAVLVGGILSVITASVMTGIGTLPTFLGLVEHVAVSLGFRAAYKSFDGPYDIDEVFDALRERREALTAAVARVLPDGGGVAGAAG